MERQVCRNSSRLSRLSFVLSLLLLCGILHSAHAQGYPGKISLRLDASLKGSLTYWFELTDKRKSLPLPLPQKSRDGLVHITVPVEYNTDTSVMKIRNANMKKVANVSVANARKRDPRLDANIIKNGYFTENAENWNLDQLENGRGNIEGTGDAPPQVTGRSLKVSVTAKSKEPYHTQLLQRGIHLDENTDYTLVFWVRANQTAKFSVEAVRDREDYRKIGLQKSLVAESHWQKFVIPFRALNTEPNHTHLSFLLNYQLATFEIAGIRLFRGNTAQPQKPNIIRNSDFTRNNEGWTPLLTLNTAKATLSYPSSGEVTLPRGVTGRVARVTVQEAGQNPWDVSLKQNLSGLLPGGSYTLTFWAKANRACPLTVSVTPKNPASLINGDYVPTILGLSASTVLEEDWKEYSVAFVALHTQGFENQVAFDFGETKATVDIANVNMIDASSALNDENVPPASQTTITETSNMLLPEHFKLSEKVEVKIMDGNVGVAKVEARLFVDKILKQTYNIQMEDKGVAVFTDIDSDYSYMIGITYAKRVYHFTRKLKKSNEYRFDPIILPENNGSSPTIFTRGALSNHPLTGMWRIISSFDKDSGTDNKRYLVELYANGRGLRAELGNNVDSFNRISLYDPFELKWASGSSKSRVKIDGIEYRWSFQVVNGVQQLELVSNNGNRYIAVKM